MTRRWKRWGVEHIEVEGGIVNIREGLHDMSGHKVTSIEIIPDEYADEKWVLKGVCNNRLVKVK